ncbi:MAG: hypothetical protein P8J02_08350 [Yoonia sp.]|nr:hypothetical protein [Yoonia sp.]
MVHKTIFSVDAVVKFGGAFAVATSAIAIPQEASARSCSTNVHIAHSYEKAAEYPPCTIYGEIMNLSKSGDITGLVTMRRSPQVQGEVQSYLLIQTAMAVFEKAMAEGGRLTEDVKKVITNFLMLGNMPVDEVDSSDGYYRLTKFQGFLAVIDLFNDTDIGWSFWEGVPVSERVRVSWGKNDVICTLRNLAPEVPELAVTYSVDYRGLCRGEPICAKRQCGNTIVCLALRRPPKG